jgi:hypothetical protein
MAHGALGHGGVALVPTTLHYSGDGTMRRGSGAE